MAHTVSYLVYTLLLLVFIKWKIKVLPVSKKMFPVLCVVLVMFALNWVWSIVLSPWFAGLFAKPIYGELIDAALKSLLFVILGLAALYKLRVSQSVNDLLDKILNFAKK